MKQPAKRNSSRLGEDKIQFHKKKKIYKDSLEKERVEKDKSDDKDADVGEEVPRPGTKERARYELTKYFKNEKIGMGPGGTVKCENRQLHFSYDDLISDLIADNKRRSGNLNQAELTQALIELDSNGMPTSLVRSGKIRKVY